MTTPRSRCRRLIVFGAAVAAASALVGVAQAGTNTTSRTASIHLGGHLDAPKIGTLRAVFRGTYPGYQLQVTVRGSVRLAPGTWCVKTILLPQSSRRVSHQRTVTLTRTGTVLVPRFTGRHLGRVVSGDTVYVEAVRVRVLEGGCAGSEIARGAIGIGGGG